MKRKKILVVSNMYPSKTEPQFGIFVENVAKMLRALEYKVVVVAKKKNKCSIMRKIAEYLVLYYLLIKEIVNNKLDCYYLHYVSHTILPFILMGKLVRKPIIAHVHGGDVYYQKGANRVVFGIKKMLVKKAFDIAYIVIVPSNSYKNYLVEEYGLPENRISVFASGGVDTEVFKPCRDSNGSSISELTIGFVGRLEEVKGLGVLLNTVKEITEEIEQLQCVVVGSGGKEKEYKKLVKKLGIEKNVEFVGAVEQENLREFMCSFDILVFPSFGESLGLVGLESMACKTFVIASKVSGITEYIVDGVSGLLFEAGDHRSLAKAIQEYVSMSEAEKRKIIDKGYDVVKSNYSKEVQMEVIDNIFKSVCQIQLDQEITTH